MSEGITTTTLKTVFRFPFQGPDWQRRFVIGAALFLAGSFVPIVPLVFVYGYVLGIMRQAVDGEELTLPAWDEWGRLGIDGLRVMLVGLVYMLPAIIVYFGGMGFYFVSNFAFPWLAAITDEGGTAFAGVLFLLLMFISMAVMFLSMAIGSLLFLVGAIPLPVATAHLAVHDQVAAAFRVREWWPVLRTNKLGYVVAWVVAAGLLAVQYFALMIVYYTVVLCCFVPFLIAPVLFYVSLVTAALFGETYRESVTMLAREARAAAE